MKTLILTAFVLLTTLTLQAKTVSEPVIKAFIVKGQVTLTDGETGQEMPLKKGDLLDPGDTITTEADSSALLLFSNGSTINLVPNSQLTIKTFEQASFTTEVVEFDRLEADPSVSQTELNLNYGKLVGNVRKLNPSSTYVINSPTGSAGIRGTTFVMATLTRDQASSLTGSNAVAAAQATLTVTEGVVEFTVGETTYSVTQGNTVSVPVTVNGVAGTIQITNVGEATESDAVEQDLVEVQETTTELQNNDDGAGETGEVVGGSTTSSNSVNTTTEEQISNSGTTYN